MPASFDANDANAGNAPNTASGNATSSSGGWFFADRVNLPLVTAPDTGPNVPASAPMIGSLPIINVLNFSDRNWSAEWYAWLALNQFAATPLTSIDPHTQPTWPNWVPYPAPTNWSALNEQPQVQGEIQGLVTAAMDERADALAEILSQADEFISYFLNMMTARPGAYPQTTRVLSIASLVGTFVAMYFKNLYARPRPSQLSPALLPPIEVPGHASFPSGHSTQAHLMALCMNEVFNGLPQQSTMVDDLWTLADRIARNREIAGLHYPSDSAAGVAIAQAVLPKLKAASQTKFNQAVAAAAEEWT
jgi:membrane-associated phospholipid phosphatase